MMAAWFGALLWSGACGAAEGVGKVTVNDAGDYLLSFDGQVVAIPFYKVDGVLLNDRCLRSPECLALQKLNGPHPPVELTISQFGTPASAYCDHLGGVPMILRDARLNESGFCAFADNSLIDTWILYGQYQAAKSGRAQ
jgi:putative hemolysin